MKNFSEGKPFLFWLIIVVTVVLTAIALLASCGFRKKPSTLVEDLVRTIERGEIDQAAAFMSQGLVSRQGIDTIKESLRQTALWIKNDGGVKSIKVLKEDTVGDIAEVTIEVTRGGGDSSVVHYRLIREQGEWKVDGVASDSSGNEPSQPETAVQKVVTWAHQSGAEKLTAWFAKQAAPPVCKVGRIDRSTLPDEIKYHDVDDVNQRDRVLAGLEPVMKLIGCSNKDGLVLYSALNIYAGSLPDGHIAITPGSSYLGSSVPQEHIFHDLAKLRIFLAREIFRQMIPIEKPSNGLNDADMLLQRELTLNYLAAMVSLATDKDPSIFDAAALDIATYAKPVGVVSGTQGTPSLRQVQDIFGAAKQDSADVSR